jgi:capsular exopolysaccharide synthesis family protein
VFKALPSMPPARPDARPDLVEALAVVRLRKWSIAVITLLFTAMAIFLADQQTPQYTSEAKVLVTAVDIDPTTGQFVPPDLETEAELVQSQVIASQVKTLLNKGKGTTFSGEARALLDGVSVTPVTDTDILEISYSSPSPAQAQARAQLFAEGYLLYRQQTVLNKIRLNNTEIRAQIHLLQRQLNDVEAQLDSLPPGDPGRADLESKESLLQSLIVNKQLDLLQQPDTFSPGDVIQPADLPTAPSSPNKLLDAAFGLVAGLSIGIGAAFLRDRLSGRLRTREQVEEEAGAPVVGSIPRVAGWRRSRDAVAVTRFDARSPAAEAYGFLRTSVLSYLATYGGTTVLVTSPHMGDGKTATVSDLGIALARAGKRVTLVSADLRRPRLNHFFGLAPDLEGLSEVLLGRATLDQVQLVVPVEPARSLGSRARQGATVRLITSGRVPENPAELLGSPAMAELIGELEDSADVVLVDAPPVLPVTDALVLAPLMDAVLLVVSPASATRSLVTSTRQQLDRVDAHVLGVVLNRSNMRETVNTY